MTECSCPDSIIRNGWSGDAECDSKKHKCVCRFILEKILGRNLAICRAPKDDHECSCGLQNIYHFPPRKCLSQKDDGHQCSCQNSPEKCLAMSRLGHEEQVLNPHQCSCAVEPMTCKSENHICVCKNSMYDGYVRICRTKNHECICHLMNLPKCKSSHDEYIILEKSQRAN